MKRYKLLLVLIAASIASQCYAQCSQQNSSRCLGIEYSVFAEPEVIGHSTTRIADLFGVHSLFWGVQDSISSPDGVPSPAAVTIMKESGLSLIRYGGGVNEIDWTQCVGDVVNRAPQKLTTWAPPMQCKFGIAEYENLVDELDSRASWYIANLVGLNFKTFDINLMTAAAKGHAQAVRKLAKSRAVYWELGNELGDGVQKWTAAQMSERGSAIAAAIRSVDANAIFVVPLLSFRPPWLQSEIEYNKTVANQLKQFTSNFSLHTYYENPPEGPSVEHWLSRIRDTSVRLRQQGIAQPSIWITEHSRWPEGNPSTKGWLQKWNQAVDFDAVLSTADYLIGLSQISDVGGAMWHTLRGGDWSYLLIRNGTPVLSPIGHLFRFLKPHQTVDALKTTTTLPFDSSLESIKLRASAFSPREDNPRSKSLIFWIVNRSEKSVALPISAVNFKKKSTLKSNIKILQEGNFDPVLKLKIPTEVNQIQMLSSDSNGRIKITIPSRSVVNITISEDSK